MKFNATLINRLQTPTILYMLIIVILTSITLFTGAMLFSNTVSANDDTSVVDQINITVPASCTMSGTGMNTHNANINNGLYEDEIGSTTLHAFCNDNEGFAIYAAGYTGNEVGGTNSNKLVGTTASGNATIESGIATTAGNPDISNWAMKLTMTQDSGDTSTDNAFTIDSAPNEALPSQAESGATQAPFSNYHVVPNEYTKVAHKNSMTNMTETTGGVKFTTTYAAYISKTQAADTYSGQVIYTLVHPASHAAPITYNTNANNISDVTYMQEFAVVTSENRDLIIASMVPEQQYTIQDARDGKYYTIAKYQTGTDSQTNQPIYDVWMTQNLDHDIDSARTYTNEDTDLGYDTTTSTYSTASWTPIRSTYQPTSTQTHEWCVGGTMTSQYQHNFCEKNDTPESYDPGNLYAASFELTRLVDNYTNDCYNGMCDETIYDQIYDQLPVEWQVYFDSCDMHMDNCDENLSPGENLFTNTGDSHNHLGNYYNLAAALASNDSSIFDDNIIIEQSICPAGWTLPRIGYGEDSFYSLWSQYGFKTSNYNDVNNNGDFDANEDAIWNEPLYFTTSGHFFGELEEVGIGGVFWSPVLFGDKAGHAEFSPYTTNPTPSTGNYQSLGYSIRCILRPVTTVLSSGNNGSGSGGGSEDSGIDI